MKPQRLPEQLKNFIPNQAGETCRFGEMLLCRDPDSSGYRAIHKADKMEDPGGLTTIESIADARELAKYRADGEYRPLKTAPGLKSGWIIQENDIEGFYEMIDAIYPAVFATAVGYFSEEIEPVPLRKTLDRQTGMYQFAKNITDNQANQIMRDLCAKGCLRKIAWPIDESCPFSRLPRPKRGIPMICTEACTFAVSEARRLAREAYDKANAPAEE